MKITRDAFLYMAPRVNDDFAQCATCRLYKPGKGCCAALGVGVFDDSSCGLYLFGKPSDSQVTMASATPVEAGLVHREVRCENCIYFNMGRCGLFDKLNKKLPVLFDLDSRVEAKGCCNAQIPGSEEPVHKQAPRRVSFKEIMEEALV